MSTSFPILDLILGLIFIFFLLSIITSSGVELILTLFQLRARVLAEWLYEIMDKPALNAAGFYYDQEDRTYRKTGKGTYERVASEETFALEDKRPTFVQQKGRAYELMLSREGGTQKKKALDKKPAVKLVSLGQSIMDHCTATALSEKGKSPTYIEARTFVSSLLEKITLDPEQPGSIPKDIAAFQQAIAASPLLSHELKRTILMLANEAADEARAAGSALLLFRAKLEAWYDAATDRISGHLKRKWVLPFTIAVAILITVWVNADVVAISKFLYTNKDARTELAQTARAALDTQRYHQAITAIEQEAAQLQNQSDEPHAKQGMQELKEAADRLKKNLADLQAKMPEGLPLGPDKGPGESIGAYVQRHLLGWFCSILAITMGAPFWFDLLNKIANLRGTGPKPASTTDVERKVAGTDKK